MWGSQGSADGQFQFPGDLGVALDGSVYVADTDNHRFQRFTANGDFLGKWGTQGSGNGSFSYPIDVVIATDGSVYVADQGNHRIQRFTASGGFLGKWGGQGSNNGQFRFPTGLAIGPDGSVYVADTHNSRIQRFTAAGAFLGKWSLDFLALATGIAVAPDGSVYVTPTWGPGTNRVQRFTADGAPLPTPDGLIPGRVDLDVAADGSVFITAVGFERYTGRGRFLGKWGSPGSGPGQFSTDVLDVDAAPDGTVYVADTGNHRIQRFSPTGVLQLCVNDSGFIDVGEHTFTVDPLPGVVLSDPAPAPNVTVPSAAPPPGPMGPVTVPTGGCVTLEFVASTTVMMIETIPPNANWNVASTAVTPPGALRTCETPAPNKVCAQVTPGVVTEVIFTNRRLDSPEPQA
jgi:sugar lactone lactonase YvrE